MTVCVLADVTYLLKGVQKGLQMDACIVSDLPKLKAKVINQLEELQREPLNGCWAETFLSKLDHNVFFGIELQASERLTTSHYLYAPDCHVFLLFVLKLYRAYEISLTVN